MSLFPKILSCSDEKSKVTKSRTKVQQIGMYGVKVDYPKALEWLKAVKHEDGLAVDSQIARLEEKLKKHNKRE